MIRSNRGASIRLPPPAPSSVGVDRDRPEEALLLPGRLTAFVQLEQGEDRHRLGQAVLLAEELVEVELAPAREQVAQHPEPPLERDGRPDVRGVRSVGDPQQLADRLSESAAVIDGPSGLERDPAQLRRQRRAAVEIAPPVGEQLREVGAGVAVAAVLEHPREQLVRGLLRLEVVLVAVVPRQQQTRLQLEQSGDQHEELGRRLEVQLALLLQVLDIGDHDLAELDLGEVDALAQHDRHQQVEGTREDVELEVEIGYRHANELRSAAGRLSRRRAPPRPSPRGRRRACRPRSRVPSRRPRPAPVSRASWSGRSSA